MYCKYCEFLSVSFPENKLIKEIIGKNGFGGRPNSLIICRD